MERERELERKIDRERERKRPHHYVQSVLKGGFGRFLCASYCAGVP